jgi:hypothetical protein
MDAGGMGPCLAVEGPTTKEVFEAYLDQVLAPSLESGRMVAMDNLSSHKGPQVRELIEGRGCEQILLVHPHARQLRHALHACPSAPSGTSRRGMLSLRASALATSSAPLRADGRSRRTRAPTSSFASCSNIGFGAKCLPPHSTHNLPVTIVSPGAPSHGLVGVVVETLLGHPRL